MSGDTSARRADDPLGPLGDLYRPTQWQPGWKIPVAGHRQILVWPLVLRLDDDGRAPTGGHERIEAAMDAAAAALTSAGAAEDGSSRPMWEEVSDLLDHAPGPTCTFAGAGPDWEKTQNDAQTYGEFVYFYDFLQKSLFRPAPDDTTEPPFRLWRRNGVTGLTMVLAGWMSATRYRARVERFNLYLFRVGAAVAVIELDFDGTVEGCATADPDRDTAWESRPAALADVQRAIDQLRRAYSPFFANRHETDDEGSPHGPQGAPIRFTWTGPNDEPLRDEAIDAERRDRPPASEERRVGAPPWTPTSLAAELDRLRRAPEAERLRRRTAPLADHWRQILKPLAFAGYPPDVDRRPTDEAPKAVWRHILDERIPVMSWVSLTGVGKSFGIGHEGVLSQREDLRVVSRGDWVRLCFADPPGTAPLPYAPHFLADFESEHCYDRFFPSDATDTATRYMFAGYHFSVVGAGTYFDRLISHHFRRHYFQMALLANMELAALLATSSRITNAVERLERRPNEKEGGRAAQRAEFRRELMSIQEDFLSFVHRFRFTDVSNQIQPSELYRKWRCAMRLDGLYADVKEELAAAVSFAVSVEQAETGRDAARLTAVATFGMPLALAFSFVPIFAEVIKNTDRFAPTAGAAAAPASRFDWFGSLLWASWPMLFSVAVFMFLAARSLQSLSAPPGRHASRLSLSNALAGVGIGVLATLGVVLVQLLLR